MEDEKTRIESLESEVESLTNTINEVIACLNDNQLFRKVAVDYVYNGGEEPGEEAVEGGEETVEEEEEEAVEEEEETPTD